MSEENHLPGGTTESVTVEEAAQNLLKLIPADGDTEEKSEPQQADADTAAEESESSGHTEDPTSAEDDESEDSEGAEANDPPASRKIKVKLNGVESELPEEEVAAGYQRNEDSTRKWQAASELRKQADAELALAKAERSQYAAHLNDLKSALESMQGKEPDWETLKQGDPATFAATYTSWRIGQDNIAKVAAEQANVASRAQADAIKERNALLERESERLKDVIPSWKDDAVAKAEKVEIVNYARAQGFTDEELSQVTDHRTLKLLHNAWLGSKATAAKPAIKAKIEAVKVAPPGPVATTTRSKEQVAKDAAKRVAKTGKVDDFADWLVKRTS